MATERKNGVASHSSRRQHLVDLITKRCAQLDLTNLKKLYNVLYHSEDFTSEKDIVVREVLADLDIPSEVAYLISEYSDSSLQSLHMDSTNRAYIRVSGGIMPSLVTCMCWVRTSPAAHDSWRNGAGQPIWGSSYYNGDKNYGLYIYSPNGTDQVSQEGLDNKTGRIYVAKWGGPNIAAPDANDGRWHHLCQSGQDVYLDGVKQGEIDNQMHRQVLNIGFHPDLGFPATANTGMDIVDFKGYDRKISQAELQAYVAAYCSRHSLPGLPDLSEVLNPLSTTLQEQEEGGELSNGLLFWYSLHPPRDGQLVGLRDKSGNGRDGILYWHESGVNIQATVDTEGADLSAVWRADGCRKREQCSGCNLITTPLQR